jgi:two-component system, OmpR family, copper resistance phosphate regulon response regulator CusR
MRKILLVEDETSVVSFITKGLTEEGFEVSVALDGPSGLQMILSNDFDLIILDIMLPGKTGLEVCKEVRKQNKKVAILFLTALGTSENVVIGLESGADDYLVKPFKFIELLARIRSLLRRLDHAPVSGEVIKENILRFSDLEINDYTKEVKRAERLLNLTSTEYRLLSLFMQNPRRVLSRADILESVWGVDFDMGTNVVDVYVNYLRKKMEVDKGKRLIHTIVGMGYVLKEADEDTN